MVNENPIMTWVNMALIIILILLVAIIYFVYFFRSDNLERSGLAWYVIQNNTTDTSGSFTAGSYTMYINNATTAIMILIGANSNIKTGQEFQIFNNSASTATLKGGTGVTLSQANLSVLPGALAIYVATNDNNTYLRIQ